MNITLYDIRRLGLSAALLFFFFTVFAQKDTLGRPIVTDSLSKVAKPVKDRKEDSIAKVPPPRKAIIRSAIIPGWGQIYNKKYWKAPIVWGALGISGSIFYTNLQYYRDTRDAYKVKYNIRVNNDSTGYNEIPDELKQYSEESLRYNRDQYRRYVDYSALVFILLWGLNVVDAAVDAHLKSFDVSPDLSMQIKPGYSNMAGTKGVSLVFNFK
ncbi:DUF5683 domain-containing protein [Chitinophagaceae bacterium LB-8]|uniref:DUF5683 domain-containing protein n=1 Tax=Paraflavisolibacter caeni TaxID=2982496 RepID=A0A9X2Y0T9_9BACT|nr:DUF5683 domain-containing protein [Paraflavisolibacter caeni]MCU7552432.1 DUF5683 domain-containing protein [Paraflavisolibacter caeni]